MPNYRVEAQDCPQPFWHETHRYCPACSWTEEDDAVIPWCGHPSSCTTCHPEFNDHSALCLRCGKKPQDVTHYCVSASPEAPHE